MIIDKNKNSIVLLCEKGSTENYKNFLKIRENLWLQNKTGGYTQTAIITNVDNVHNTFVLKVNNYQKLDKSKIIDFLMSNNIKIVKELPVW